MEHATLRKTVLIAFKTALAATANATCPKRRKHAPAIANTVRIQASKTISAATTIANPGNTTESYPIAQSIVTLAPIRQTPSAATMIATSEKPAPLAKPIAETRRPAEIMFASQTLERRLSRAPGIVQTPMSPRDGSSARTAADTTFIRNTRTEMAVWSITWSRISREAAMRPIRGSS
jgi:hypothetical protein